MTKNIFAFGLLAGIIISTWQVLSISHCYGSGNFEGNVLLSYMIFILAFSLMFVAIKNYRDKYSDGRITFGKAFKIGLYTALLASTVYVLVWAIDYYVFIPDFMDRYAAYVIHKTAASGASVTEIAAKTKEINTLNRLYNYPGMVILLTYMEAFPIGLIISVIAGIILKREKKAGYKPQPVH